MRVSAACITAWTPGWLGPVIARWIVSVKRLVSIVVSLGVKVACSAYVCGIAVVPPPASYAFRPPCQTGVASAGLPGRWASPGAVLVLKRGHNPASRAWARLTSWVAYARLSNRLFKRDWSG